MLTNYKFRQTDTFAKTIFSGSEGLNTWTFDKNGGGGGGGGGYILHKSNTFSDENVKTESQRTDRYACSDLELYDRFSFGYEISIL